jgi:hypothetical protein
MASVAAVSRLNVHPDRRFFGGMAVALLLVTLVGFAPTYYFSYFTTAPALRPLLHVHGVVFTAWMLLYAVQTWLIGARRVDLHRAMGVFGACLAALVFILGVVTAIGLARAKLSMPVRTGPPVIFPLGAIVAFGVLCTSAILLRRRSAHHKRLMFLATVALATTPLARITKMTTAAVAPPIGGILLTELFLLALIAFDLRKSGRLHPATIGGGLFFVASQIFRVTFGQTAMWQSFLHAAVG